MHELEEDARPHPTKSTGTLVLSPRVAIIYQRLLCEGPRADDLYVCLDHLLRLFTGLSAGLVRYLDPSRPEIEALAAGLEQPLQFERLLRFSVNLLRQQDPHPAQTALLQVFFPARRLEELSIPMHTAWLQLGSETSPLPALSRWQEHLPDQADLSSRYMEILHSWLGAAEESLLGSEWMHASTDKGDLRELRSWHYQGYSIPLMPACLWEGSGLVAEGPRGDWSPRWSVRQQEKILQVLETRFPRLEELPVPDFLLEPARLELARKASSYLLLEAADGSGKTLAISGLQRHLERELPLLHFSVRASFRGDFQTLIEEIDEGIQFRLDTQRTTLLPLGPLVIQDLNRRYAILTPAEKFQAYLSQLVLRNGQRFILALDGLDEAFEGAESDVSLADFLPDQLPDGVFLLLAYRAEGCSARLGRRLTQLVERGAIRMLFPLRSPAYRDWFVEVCRASFLSESLALELVASGYTLFSARLLGQGCELGFFDSDPRPAAEEILAQVLERLDRVWGEPFMRFLMVLATSYAPVALEELSDMGFEPVLIERLLGDIPALFRVVYPAEPLGWQLQLAHENLRLHLQEHYSHRFSQTCLRLASRAAHQLTTQPHWSRLDEETLEVGSHRLDCLYRWLLDSQSFDLTESVLRAQPLKQFRNRVCGYLEQRGRYHHKLSLLQGLKSCLEHIVQVRDSTELRDELAWAYNSRGLTYLHLGQFGKGLLELELAEQQFRVLVDHRNQVHYRSGLASALNRRSEALRALGQVGEAWECAHQAVEHHRQSLVEGGPQQPRLGLARSLVQRARCAADHSLWPRALTDLGEALNLLEHSTRQAQGRANPSEVAAHFDEWIRALLVRAEAYRVVEENDNCLIDLDQALLLTQHLEEVQAGDWSDTRAPEVQVLQARAYEALNGLEEARDAYSEAIQGYSQQVREGRLDLRLPLAEACCARAELHQRAGRYQEAIEDFTRSLAFQAQLVECEEQANLRPFRAQAYQGRGDCLAVLQRRREALQDYDKAIEDFLFGLNSGKLSQLDLRKLASVYFASGQLHQDLGESSQAADRASSAIRLLEERLGGSPGEGVARAHLLQAEAFYQLGDVANGYDSASKAIQALSLRVRGDSCNLERELAQAHRLRAGLSHQLGDLNQALKDYGLAFHLYGGEGLEPDRLQQAGVLRRRAGLQVEFEDFEAALEDLSAAFDLLSDNHRPEAMLERLALRRLKAQILEALSRLGEASGELLLALEEQRQNGLDCQGRLEVLIELLRLQARLHQWQDFSILYSEFLQVREALPEVWVADSVTALFADIEAQSPEETSSGVVTLFQKEQEAEARVDVLVALARLHNQLAPEGEGQLQARALHQRGRHRLRVGKTTEALEDFSEAIAQLRATPESQFAPLLIDLYLQRASGLAAVGLDSRAVRDLEEASQMLVDPARDLNWLLKLTLQKVALLRKQNHHSQILQEVNRVLSLASAQNIEPESLGWLYLARALAQDGLQDRPRAASDFREAAQLLSQAQMGSREALQERLRCRLRLLELEDPSHSSFVVFCAEDGLVCLTRLRRLDSNLGALWLPPWLQQLASRNDLSLPERFLGDLIEELAHYLPGPLTPEQCQKMSRALGSLGARLARSLQAERLLGVSLQLSILGPLPQSTRVLLENLALLFHFYASETESVPALNLEAVGETLQQVIRSHPPSGELGILWNNVVRSWLSLSDSQLAACKVDRGQWQALRLW